MTEFLLFRLYGPLASWGDIAVGERRAGFARPSKSAVLGIVAAALGIRRTERERQAKLAEGYGFAVRVDAPGQSLRDYHTAQTARKTDIKKLLKLDPRPLTRKRLLSAPSLETILSSRDYLADALSTVALWKRADAPHELAAIQSALKAPVFSLYLGRKSCPPALPLAPDVIEAENLLGALKQYAPADIGLRVSPHPLLAWEDDVVPLAGVQMEQRRDSSRDRARWLFAERQEKVAVMRDQEGM